MPEVQKRQRVRIGYQPTMQSLSAGERGLKCAEALQDEERRRHHGRVPAMRVHLEGVRKSRDCKGKFSSAAPAFFLCLPDSFAYWQCSIFAAAGWAVSNLEKSVSSRSASILLFRMSRNVTSCVINSNSRMEKSTRTNRFSTSSLLR